MRSLTVLSHRLRLASGSRGPAGAVVYYSMGKAIDREVSGAVGMMNLQDRG